MVKIEDSSNSYASHHEKWIAPHLEVFRGKHVAIDPTRGIVASGESLDEVLEVLKKAHIDPMSVVHDIIPDSAF